jgi:membrane-associated phospholipid phosphatase
MVCVWITFLIFWAFPAEGPFMGFGFQPSAEQASYLEHMRALRAGEYGSFTYRYAEGLVTFPSFHTIAALLCAMAYVHRRLLFFPFAILNAAVILSTITTGWHYLSDVLAGIAVYGAVLAVTRLLEPWLYPRNSCNERGGSSERRTQRDNYGREAVSTGVGFAGVHLG